MSSFDDRWISSRKTPRWNCLNIFKFFLFCQNLFVCLIFSWFSIEYIRAHHSSGHAFQQIQRLDKGVACLFNKTPTDCDLYVIETRLYSFHSLCASFAFVGLLKPLWIHGIESKKNTNFNLKIIFIWHMQKAPVRSSLFQCCNVRYGKMLKFQWKFNWNF